MAKTFCKGDSVSQFSGNVFKVEVFAFFFGIGYFLSGFSSFTFILYFFEVKR